MIEVCLAIGLAVGLVLGVLGGGGSILLVPALTQLAGIALPTATTAALFVVGSSSGIGAAANLRRGRVNVRSAAVLVALGVPASFAGTSLAARASDAAVLSVLGIAMAASALTVLLRSREGRPPRRRPAWMTAVAACAVGLLTGFTGAGGGFIVVPVLVGILGLSMRTAVPTSLAVIAGNCAVSLVLRAVGGLQIDWDVVVPTTITAIVGSLAGSRLSDRLRTDQLGRAFAVLLLVVAVALVAQQF